MTETRYKLVVAEDKTIWCPLQPLHLDIEEKLREPDLNVHVSEKLETVLSFISALIVEGEQQEPQQ